MTKRRRAPDAWPASEIVRRRVEDLAPRATNPRTHSDSQIAKIAASIKEWGWTTPILIDEKDGVLAGHGRLAAAKLLGIADVPCVVARGWTDAQKRAYVIADNQLTLASTWDDDLLRVELGELGALDFNLDLLGFGAAELGGILGGEEAKQDDVPAVPKKAVSQTGDLWLCGEHRLLCGDLRSADVDVLLGGQHADLCVADPPYNVGFKYASHDDSMQASDYAEFVRAFMVLAEERSAMQIITPGEGNQSLYDPIGWMVWHKGFALTGGSFYKAVVAEPVLLFGRKPKGKFYGTNNIAVSTDREPGLLDGHPCPKPVGLFAALIEPMTSKGDSVFDPFLGSGTTLIAAEQLGRRCFGIEIEPRYVDVIVQRWQNLTGKAATLEASGDTFDAVAAERHGRKGRKKK